jgi:hypothetical protein
MIRNLILSPSSGEIHYRLSSTEQAPSEEGDKLQSPKWCVLNTSRTKFNVQKQFIWALQFCVWGFP